MATQEELDELRKNQVAAEDFFRARALAQGVYYELQNALAKGAEIAAYNQNPLIPAGAADELRTIMGKAQAFYADLDANHHALLKWAPQQEA